MALYANWNQKTLTAGGVIVLYKLGAPVITPTIGCIGSGKGQAVVQLSHCVHKTVDGAVVMMLCLGLCFYLCSLQAEFFIKWC